MNVTGVLLTRWSIRLALAMAGGAVAWNWWTERRGWRGARSLWTAGCLLGLTHAAVAMAVYHGASHQAALEATRRETFDVLGIDWSGGLYVNYAFLALWTAEVAWWWLAPASFARRPWLLRQIWYGTFAGIVFFGAVVFEEGIVRWLTLAGLLLVGAMTWSMRNRNEVWPSPSREGDVL